MTQFLFPMVGQSVFFEHDDFHYPKPIVEINNKTMVELCMSNYINLPGQKRFIFLVNDEDCRVFHLDDVLTLLVENKSILRVRKQTSGAACTCLLAIDELDPSAELVIANYDQYFTVDLSRALESFRASNADVGVVTFESVHPKWSYVRLDSDGTVCEFAEKRPLSREAIAGFYYFRRAEDFLYAAKQMIRKDGRHEGQFYIAPALNELVLQSRKITTYRLNGERDYWSFYSPAKISEFEKRSLER